MLIHIREWYSEEIMSDVLNHVNPLDVIVCIVVPSWSRKEYVSSERIFPWWRHGMGTFLALMTLDGGIHRSPVDSLTKGQKQGSLIPLWCHPEETVDPTREWPMIWNAMVLIWHQCNTTPGYINSTGTEVGILHKVNTMTVDVKDVSRHSIDYRKKRNMPAFHEKWFQLTAPSRKI